MSEGNASAWTNWVLVGLLARWLGHGRAMESYLALVSLSYGITLAFYPSAGFSSQATRDITWLGLTPYLAALMLTKGSISLYGLVANINGFPFSRPARICGAVVGLGVWSWYIGKFAMVGDPFTLGSFFSGVALLFCIRTIGLASANLPRPGALGAL